MDVHPDTILRITRLREGGNVTRCHTVPHHGHYDVAQHSWGVTILLTQLYPEASGRLLRAALTHDVEERWTGDVPAFCKWAHQKVRDGLEEAEDCIRSLVGLEGKLGLDEVERMWLKAADLLDLWLWCHDQRAMGNRNVEPLMSNIARWFAENQHQVPERAMAFYRQYIWQRTGDFLEAR